MEDGEDLMMTVPHEVDLCLKEAWLIQITIQLAVLIPAGIAQEMVLEIVSTELRDRFLNVDTKQRRNAAKEDQGRCVDAVQHHHADVVPV